MIANISEEINKNIDALVDERAMNRATASSLTSWLKGTDLCVWLNPFSADGNTVDEYRFEAWLGQDAGVLNAIKIKTSLAEIVDSELNDTKVNGLVDKEYHEAYLTLANDFERQARKIRTAIAIAAANRDATTPA